MHTTRRQRQTCCPGYIETHDPCKSNCVRPAQNNQNLQRNGSGNKGGRPRSWVHVENVFQTQEIKAVHLTQRTPNVSELDAPAPNSPSRTSEPFCIERVLRVANVQLRKLLEMSFSCFCHKMVICTRAPKSATMGRWISLG